MTVFWFEAITFVLEIRENPRIREDKHNEFIRRILDNYDKKPKLVGDQ